MGRRLLAVEVPVGSESYHRFESAFFVGGRKATSFVEFLGEDLETGRQPG